MLISKHIDFPTCQLLNSGLISLFTHLSDHPYEAIYVQRSPLNLPYISGYSAVEELDVSLLTREFKLQLLKYHLQRAQQRMIIQVNKHILDKKFKKGNQVYLKIQTYKQIFLYRAQFSKLSSQMLWTLSNLAEDQVCSLQYINPTTAIIAPNIICLSAIDMS